MENESAEENARCVEERFKQNMENVFMTEKELAKRWNVSVKVLQKWRVVGGGPKFLKMRGSLVRYRLSDVEVFEDASLRSHTSEKRG